MPHVPQELLLGPRDPRAIASSANKAGSWSQNPDTGEVVASASCRAVFGLSSDAPFNYSEFLALIHPDDRIRVSETVKAAIATKVPYAVEYRITTPLGEQRWISSHAELRQGAPLIAGFAIDITERRRVEEHQAVLTGELTHRVKNALATVNGVVNLTLRDACSLQSARRIVSGRIASLADAHDILLCRSGAGADIAEITRRAIAPFADAADRRFIVEGPSVRLDADTTMALAMALHELATNAVKYGALSVPNGCICLRWSIEGEGADHEPCLSFRWEESGGPRVTPPLKFGFGTLMIDQVLSRRAGGSTQTTYDPAGVSFHFKALLRS